jgi:hypothetical protein
MTKNPEMYEDVIQRAHGTLAVSNYGFSFAEMLKSLMKTSKSARAAVCLLIIYPIAGLARSCYGNVCKIWTRASSGSLKELFWLTLSYNSSDPDRSKRHKIPHLHATSFLLHTFTTSLLPLRTYCRCR